MRDRSQENSTENGPVGQNGVQQDGATPLPTGRSVLTRRRRRRGLFGRGRRSSRGVEVAHGPGTAPEPRSGGRGDAGCAGSLTPARSTPQDAVARRSGGTPTRPPRTFGASVQPIGIRPPARLSRRVRPRPRPPVSRRHRRAARSAPSRPRSSDAPPGGTARRRRRA